MSEARQELARRLGRLEDARRRVLARIASEGDGVLNCPRAEGWSALQVLHHVVTAEELTLAYVRKKMQAGPSLPRAGLGSRLKLLAVQAVLASPLRVRAPAQVAGVPERLDAATLVARWEGVRRGWRELIDGFPAELEQRLVFRHPFAGRMSLPHALGTLEAHLDHHMAQIEQALSAAVQSYS